MASCFVIVEYIQREEGYQFYLSNHCQSDSKVFHSNKCNMPAPDGGIGNSWMEQESVY